MLYCLFLLYLLAINSILSAPVIPFDSLMEDRIPICYLDQKEENNIFLEQYSLHLSIATNDFGMFNSLLPHSNVDEVCPYGLTPLLHALQIGPTINSIYFIKKLLEAGANPFLKSNVGVKRSFIEESFHYKFPTMEFINFMKSNFELHWSCNRNILQSAINANNNQLIFIIIKEIDFVMDDYFLDTYCDLCHFTNIKQYLNTKYDQDTIIKLLIQSIEGLTIHSAIKDGNELAIKIFIKIFSVNPENLNEDGETALHLAIYHDNFRVMQLLIDERCSLDTENRNGQTALMIAIEMGRKPHAEYLLKRGADIDAIDYCGKNALHIALEKGDCDITYILLEHYYETQGSHLVSDVDSSSCFSFKKTNSINRLDVQDSSGRTALHRALLSKKFDIALMLIESGCCVDVIEDIFKWTPLHYAVTCGNTNVVKALIKRGCKLWVKDCHGKTPLYLACIDGKLTECELIIGAYKTSIKCKSLPFLSRNPLNIATTKSKFTALHAAASIENKGIIKLLLESGCNPRKKNSSECTAIDLTLQKDIKDLIHSYY